MNRVPAIPDGALHVRLPMATDAHRVAIESERAVLASRVFEGKSLRQVLQLMPLLFNVCGHAQAIAGVRAAERALRLVPSLAVEQQRDVLLALEILREHLWRFFIDWPACLGMRSDAASLAPFNRLLLQLANELDSERHLTATPAPHRGSPAVPAAFAEHWRRLKPALQRAVFGQEHVDARLDTLPPQGPADVLVATLSQGGYARIGKARFSPLPALAESELALILAGNAAESFVRYPQWAGECHETGPYARQRSHPLTQAFRQRYGAGVAARMAARLAEILAMCERIDACIAGASLLRPFGDASCASGCGIAQVEAARGRLLHYLQLEGDTVTRYRIVAPTEWNFHPEGVLVDMLSGLDSRGEVRLAQARLLVCLVDPCVSCRVSADAREPGSTAGRDVELSDA